MATYAESAADKPSLASSVFEKESSEQHSPRPAQKVSSNGRVLVPQPSDDPNDPLNWPLWRKSVTFATLCLAAFAGLGSAIAHANGLVVQAKAYHTTPTAMSYSICSAVAGLMAGPYFIIPLARVIGTNSTIFWCLVGMIATGAWSAKMTGRHDYKAFVISRLFGGLFSSSPQILGNGIIVDMFYLHERGRAFAVYTTSYALGVVAGPTFDGFIVEHTSWSVEFWWTIALQGIVLILVFSFLEETCFDRSKTILQKEVSRHSFLVRRLLTFFSTKMVARTPSVSDVVTAYTTPMRIFFSPVTIFAGIFDMINFGWAVLVSTLLGIFLQEKPPKGYGFSPQRAAGFCFVLWIGVFAAQAYSYLLNDRIPLWIASRRGNRWKPEYRLYTLWPLSAICMPIGLGLFGSALEYQLHYMVLALGCFFIYLSSNGAVSAPTNYLVETFRQDPQEVGIALNVWRLLLGLIIPFFIEEWEEKVGVGWVFGMAAFFNLFASCLVFILMWKGPAIRKISLEAQDLTEEGTRVGKVH